MPVKQTNWLIAIKLIYLTINVRQIQLVKYIFKKGFRSASTIFVSESFVQNHPEEFA